jgi:hypothetical protein
MTQIIMGQLVFSSLSRCHPSSQGVSLCRSPPDGSFGFASVLIFRRCFFLQDLRRRSGPPTLAYKTKAHDIADLGTLSQWCSCFLLLSPSFELHLLKSAQQQFKPNDHIKSKVYVYISTYITFMR